MTEKFWTKCGDTDRPSIFDFGLFQGGAGRAHKILHGLHRVLPSGGLPGEHHAGSAVCYGVVDVADLGAGGDRPAAHTVQHLGHHHKGHPGRPADCRKLFLAPGQLPQGHGVAKVPAGNDHFIHKRQELRQGLYPRKVLDFGKNADLPGPGLFQRPAQGANVLGPPHEGQHHPGNAAGPRQLQVLQVLLRQRGGGHRQPRCRKAFAALQGAAPYHSTLQGSAIGFGHLHKELAVVQQEVLARPGCMHQRRRAGDTPLPQPEALARFQHKGLGQRANAQLRPLQVDEQLGDAHGVDDIQPIFVGRKGPVGKVHADARHASFHHALQGLRLGTGGANGTIKFQKNHPVSFFPIVTRNGAVEKCQTGRQRKKAWQPAPKGKMGRARTKKLLQKYYFFVNISTLLSTLLTHGAITVACSGGRAKGEPQGSPESLSEWTLQIFAPTRTPGLEE